MVIGRWLRKDIINSFVYGFELSPTVFTAYTTLFDFFFIND